jgi:hypothetical protein
MSELASEAQIKMMYVLFKKLGLSESGIKKRKRQIHVRFDVMSTMRLSKSQMSVVLSELTDELEELEKSKIKLF